MKKIVNGGGNNRKKFNALGLKALRTDTHRKNKAMLRLLRESGYRYRGNIRWPVEEGHDATGQAYEKLLKK